MVLANTNNKLNQKLAIGDHIIQSNNYQKPHPAHTVEPSIWTQKKHH